MFRTCSFKCLCDKLITRWRTKAGSLVSTFSSGLYHSCCTCFFSSHPHEKLTLFAPDSFSPRKPGFKSCDAATGRCTCLPGVGGTLCDRCLHEFWGMQNIKYGSNGCTRKYPQQAWTFGQGDQMSLKKIARSLAQPIFWSKFTRYRGKIVAQTCVTLL
jgi:hypothetical protein